MASLRGTSNLFSLIPKRYVSSSSSSAAAAAAQAKADPPKQTVLPKHSIRTTKLNGGVVATSIENNSPITRVAAVLNVGSRDEDQHSAGATHALRVYSSLATRNYSAFGVSRNLDQIGAQLTVTSNREQISYVLEATRQNFARGLEILGEIVSKPELRHWEIHDAHPRLVFDLDVYDEMPEKRLVDLIHKASFRSGLSRSLVAPRYNLHHLDSETLSNFRQKFFTSDRLSLIGVGVNHDELLRYHEHFGLPAGSANNAREKSKFLGNEIREENLSDLVHVAIASEGASLNSKDYLASGVAAHAFGIGSRIKYASSATKLARAAAKEASEPAFVSSFNANYSDTGLFGFHVIANKKDVGKVVKAVAKEVAKASKNGLSAEEIAAAKQGLKTTLLYSLENSLDLVNAISQNPSNPTQFADAAEISKAVDALSANDINAFIKRMSTGKSSMAAIGDTSNLPNIDELTA